MLEVGAVRRPRRPHDHGRVAVRRRRDLAQGAEQQLRVVVDRAHAVAGEQLRRQPGHRQPVLEHVGDPRRRAAVVLEHPPAAVGVADQVTAGDVAVDAARRAHAVHGAPKLRRAEDQLPGHDPLADDLAPVVDVVDERVQRPQPLRQPALDRLPLGRRDDPWHEVERKRPVLDSGTVGAGDREGDPLLAEDLVAAAAEIDHRQPPDRVEGGDQLGGVRARRPRCREQLVDEAGGRLVAARLAHESSRSARLSFVGHLGQDLTHSYPTLCPRSPAWPPIGSPRGP